MKHESHITLDKLFLCESKSSDSLYPQITQLLHTGMYTGFYPLDLGMKRRQPSPETAAVAALLSSPSSCCRSGSVLYTPASTASAGKAAWPWDWDPWKWGSLKQDKQWGRMECDNTEEFYSRCHSSCEGRHGVSLQLPLEFLQCNNMVRIRPLKTKLDMEIEKCWEGLEENLFSFLCWEAHNSSIVQERACRAQAVSNICKKPLCWT